MNTGTDQHQEATASTVIRDDRLIIEEYDQDRVIDEAELAARRYAERSNSGKRSVTVSSDEDSLTREDNDVRKSTLEWVERTSRSRNGHKGR